MSTGIQALAGAMEGLGEVWVVAPLSEQSASSHAISIHRPVRLHEVRPRWYAVDGTPTDCSWIGINHLLRDHRPRLMVSGINHGPNLADDVTYSGTVAAAMESRSWGCPPSPSAWPPGRSSPSVPPRGSPALSCRRALARTGDLLPGMLVNVNVPDGEPDGYVVTRLGKHSYGSDVVEKVDPRGRKYYWIGGNEYQHEDIPGSDCSVVLRQRRISVTPLQLDLTDDGMLPRVAAWPVDGFTRHRA